MAQITITVNPFPADAEVKINGNIGNTSSVESDSEVSILVSKSGYATQEIIDRYSSSETVSVELQSGNDLEPTITVSSPRYANTTINGSSTTSKTVVTGDSVNVRVTKDGCMPYEETFVLTHNLDLTVYLEEGNCWFVDDSSIVLSGEEQQIRPTIQIKTSAASAGFMVDSDTDWLRWPFRANVIKEATYDCGLWVPRNLTGSPRSMTIRLSNQSDTETWDTIELTQEALEICFVKEEISAPCERTEGYLSVRCASQSTRWTVSTNSSWITLSGTVGTGDSENGVSYTIAENPNSTTRTGEITISSDNYSYTVPVTQGLNPEITRPSVEESEFTIDAYEDTDITISILDPANVGWRLEGAWFRGVLNPNDWTGSDTTADWAHPEFGGDPDTVDSSEGIAGSGALMRQLTGTGNTTVRALFHRIAWESTNTLVLYDTEGEKIQDILFIPTDDVISQWDAEYGADPATGVTFNGLKEVVLDLGDREIYTYAYATPEGAAGMDVLQTADSSIASYVRSGYLLAKKAGVTTAYGYVRRPDGTYTDIDNSDKVQVVVWDKNNLSQDFQFESHKTITLGFGDTKTIKLLRKPDSKIHLSDIWFWTPGCVYSIINKEESSDGTYINITIAAGSTTKSGWLMVVYGGIIDKVAVNVNNNWGGPKSGFDGNSKWSTDKGSSMYWTPNEPVRYQFEYNPNAVVSPLGLTMMEGEVKTIRGNCDSVNNTHTNVRGTSVRAGSPVILNTDNTYNNNSRYEIQVESIGLGTSYVDLVRDSDNAIRATYMVVVQDEGDGELRSIKLVCPDTKCVPGKTYRFGFSCVPSSYHIRDYNSSTSTYSDRDRVVLEPEKDDADNCISSFSVVSDVNREKSGDAYYSLNVKFKEGASGRAGVRFGIKDKGIKTVSNTAILDISSRNTLTSGTIEFSEESITLDINDGPVDLSQYLVFSGFSESDSKYYWFDGSDSNGVIKFSSDGKSISPASIGESRVFVKYHYNGMEGTAPALKGTGASILIKVKDQAEDDIESFNIRFKVSEVRIDRSANIHGKSASQSSTGSQTSDFSEQLHSKYGEWSVKDLIAYNDPRGVFDRQRLVVRYENEDGQALANENIPGYDVAFQWAEGQVYLAAYYGATSSSAQIRRARIPFIVETSNPDYIPIRSLSIACRIPDATLAKWKDFSQWYPFTKFFKIYPKDALLDSSEFRFSTSGIEGDGARNEVVHVQTYNPSGKTADERYRVRLAGIGGYGKISRMWNTGRNVINTGADGGMILCWPDGTAQGSYRPNSVSLSAPKNSISRGEYIFVHATPTPNLDFAMIEEMEWRYTVDGTTYYTKDNVNRLGIFDIICETRRGVIIRGGSATGTHTIKVWMDLISPKQDPEVTITLLPSAFNPQGGTPRINIQRDGNNKILDGQVATLSNGIVEGWACDNWLLSSITQEGLIRTFTAGNVTYYAVTTDGRLAYESGSTKDTITGWEPIDPHESMPTPVDSSPREAATGEDNLDLGFEDNSEITFSSPESEPVRRKVVKGATTFSINSVSCTTEKPGIVSVEKVILDGEMYVQITPQRKGKTKVYVVYGGAADSINVEVIGGEIYTPSISYKDTTGVSLNIYEYISVEFKVLSRGVFDEILFTSDNSKIIVDKGNYDPITGTGTFTVYLNDKVSGNIRLTYGSEILDFPVVNRYNLAFESISNFILGVGATRYIKIYPLDDVIQDSEVSISSQNGNVTIGQIYEARDTQGERIFVVPITYKSAGRDVLIASRKGDLDIYLEFDCEATSVPASSISFNTDSINLNI